MQCICFFIKSQCCPQDGVWLAVPDLVGPCRDLDDADLSGSAAEEEEEEEEEEEQDMGQRSSSLLAARTRPKLSLTWVLRGDRQSSSTTTTTTVSTADENVTPPEPSPATLINTNINNLEKPAIKYSCKNSNNNNSTTKLNSESNNNISNSNNNNNSNKTIGTPPTRTLSEPSLLIANSESGRSGRSSREKHRHRRTRTPRHKTDKQRRPSRFGYEIQDVDAFLTKVSASHCFVLPHKNYVIYGRFC